MEIAEIISLVVLTTPLIGLVIWLFCSKVDFSDFSKKNEPSLKEIQNVLTYVKDNFVTEGETFDEIHKEFMSENEKCYHCSSTTRAFCIKRPHSEDCQGPYDW